MSISINPGTLRRTPPPPRPSPALLDHARADLVLLDDAGVLRRGSSSVGCQSDELDEKGNVGGRAHLERLDKVEDHIVAPGPSHEADRDGQVLGVARDGALVGNLAERDDDLGRLAEDGGVREIVADWDGRRGAVDVLGTRACEKGLRISVEVGCSGRATKGDARGSRSRRSTRA
jgi:hypothetical protein